jgi:hypothetical protein
MISAETLEAAGYRSFPAHKDVRVTGAYQRTIRGCQIHSDCKETPELGLACAGEKLYFITVYIWDLGFRGSRPLQYEAEVVFYRPGPIETLRFEVSVRDGATVADLEALCSEIYVKLGCIPDIHNN